MNRHGFSIGTTLLIVSILALLGATVAGLSATHQSLILRNENNGRIKDAARSVVEQTIAKIFHGSISARETVRYSDGEIEAVLTFDPNFTEDETLPVSTNNLLGTEVVPDPNGGSPFTIPAATARLVGRASYRGQVREVDVLLYIPPFPYAIACEGELQADSGIIVGQLLDDLPVAEIEKIRLAPADVGSVQGVRLGGGSRVTGNVETRGQIQLGSDVEIGGELRSEWDSVRIPALHPGTFDPNSRGLTSQEFGRVIPPETEDDEEEIVPWNDPNQDFFLTGIHRGEGNHRVGEVRLLNGTLFVNGDLSIHKGLTGQGVIVVTGDLTVHGGARLEPKTTDLALVSGGRIVLRGTSAEETSFQGVVYAGRGLDADKVSIVGALIAGGQARLVESAVFEKTGERGMKAYVVPDGVDGIDIFQGTPGWPEGTPVGSDATQEQLNEVVEELRQMVSLERDDAEGTWRFSPTPVVRDGQYDYDWKLASYRQTASINATLPGRIRLQGQGLGDLSYALAALTSEELLEYGYLPTSGTLSFKLGDQEQGSEQIQQKLAGEYFPLDSGLAGPNLFYDLSNPYTSGFFEVRVALDTEATQYTANTYSPEINPAVVLQEISKVMPIADRTRVLSWIER